MIPLIREELIQFLIKNIPSLKLDQILSRSPVTYLGCNLLSCIQET